MRSLTTFAQIGSDLLTILILLYIVHLVLYLAWNIRDVPIIHSFSARYILAAMPFCPGYLRMSYSRVVCIIWWSFPLAFWVNLAFASLRLL